MRTASILSAGFSGVLIAALGCQVGGVRFNHTPSMPLGLWREAKAPSHVYVAGDVVEVCPPLAGWERRYLDPGPCPTGREPMLKPVAAVAGDQVVISIAGVIVNGRPIPNTAPLAHDGAGRPLLGYAPGVYRVAFGQVWLLVPLPYSLDSRYLGPVFVSAIQGLVSPVLVWR